MLWIKRLALETGILESWWKARAIILVYFWPFMNRNEADAWVWKKYPLLLSAIKKQCGDMVAFTLTYILGMRFGTWTVPYLKALKEGLCLRAGAQSLTNAQWLGQGSETTTLWCSDSRNTYPTECRLLRALVSLGNSSNQKVTGLSCCLLGKWRKAKLREKKTAIESLIRVSANTTRFLVVPLLMVTQCCLETWQVERVILLLSFSWLQLLAFSLVFSPSFTFISLLIGIKSFKTASLSPWYLHSSNICWLLCFVYSSSVFS